MYVSLASAARRHAAALLGGPTQGLAPLQVDRHEIAGGLADIGVMIPLAVGVAAVTDLSLAIVFLCVAVVYAITAFAFRVPVPVQPMKAMAAATIALGLSPSVVGAAGIEIGVLMLLVAVTPLSRVLGRLFPKPVVRGIQLAIGLLLVKSALRMAGAVDALPGTGLSLDLGPVILTAGAVLALAIGVVLLLSKDRSRLPMGLVVLGAGAAGGVALAAGGVMHLDPVSADVRLPLLHLPSLDDMGVAFFAVVLPQLPLSLGNAVFATDDVLRHYFGTRARRVTPGHLCLSMGLANVGCGLLGGMPLCHGSGGATAHYRLGARTGAATIVAAGLYAGLAAAAAFGLSPLFVPGAVLAGMLVFVGVEHVLLVTDLVTVDDIVCAVVIAGIALAVNNLAVGFLVGWVLSLALRRTRLHGFDLRWPRLTERLAPEPAKAEVR